MVLEGFSNLHCALCAAKSHTRLPQQLLGSALRPPAIGVGHGPKAGDTHPEMNPAALEGVLPSSQGQAGTDQGSRL